MKKKKLFNKRVNERIFKIMILEKAANIMKENPGDPTFMIEDLMMDEKILDVFNYVKNGYSKIFEHNITRLIGEELLHFESGQGLETSRKIKITEKGLEYLRNNTVSMKIKKLFFNIFKALVMLSAIVIAMLGVFSCRNNLVEIKNTARIEVKNVIFSYRIRADNIFKKDAEKMGRILNTYRKRDRLKSTDYLTEQKERVSRLEKDIIDLNEEVDLEIQEKLVKFNENISEIKWLKKESEKYIETKKNINEKLANRKYENNELWKYYKENYGF